MKAIYKRELASHLRGLVGWIAIAMLLFVTGIYFTAYNLQGQIPYFGYVLGSISFILIFLCPALSMRTFAEERKQKPTNYCCRHPYPLPPLFWGNIWH